MIRGLFTHQDYLYAVQDDKLYSVAADGTFVYRGTLNSTGGALDFASNLTQLCISDGSYLYVYVPSLNTFNTSVAYPGGDRIGFIDQRIVFLIRGGQEFGWTGLGDAMSIDSLAFASAEGSPDGLVSLLCNNREIWLFGTESTEIWVPTGDERVFARQGSAYIQYGCAAVNSARVCASDPIWLARDERGQAMVLKGSGWQPQRISTRAIEERFEGLDVSTANAWCYSEGGQQFYLLNVPNVDTTLVYDATFGQWHERAELDGAGYKKFRPTCHAFAYGYHFVGADDGTIYKLDSTANDFSGDPKVRERIAPVISAPSRKRLRFPSFEVISEKATSANAMLRYSDDNGANWSNWRYASTGSTGQFSRRIRFNMLGSGFDRVYQLRMADAVAWNPVDVNVVVE